MKTIDPRWSKAKLDKWIKIGLEINTENLMYKYRVRKWW